MSFALIRVGGGGRGATDFVLWAFSDQCLPNWSGIKLCVVQCTFEAVFCLH